jgi:hypothetical protein
MPTDYEHARDSDQEDSLPTPSVATGHDVIVGCLRDYFGAGDWDERWREERYFVRYRIGEVEEVLSFTPGEAIESIWVPVNEILLAAAKAGRRVDLPEEIEGLARVCMDTVETFVRCKHGLEHVLDSTRRAERFLKRLAKTDPSRRNDVQQYNWLRMVFGMAMKFRDVPAGDNCLEVIDSPPGTPPPKDARWNPAYSAEEIARKTLDIEQLGTRAYSSSRVSVN